MPLQASNARIAIIIGDIPPPLPGSVWSAGATRAILHAVEYVE